MVALIRKMKGHKNSGTKKAITQSGFAFGGGGERRVAPFLDDFLLLAICRGWD